MLKDRPRLTARLPGVVNQPLRVVLDSRLRIVEALTSLSPLRSETGEANTLLSHAVGEENKGGKGNTLIFHLAPLDERLRAKIEKLQSWGFEMVGISPDPNQPDRVPVQGVVETLAERGISSILVEGGGQVAASFLEAKLVNRVAYFYAPKLIGGAVARTALEGLGVAKVADAPRVSNVSLRKLGEDWLVEGDVEYP
ncbi:MAG: dihydrofolate reductase family protein [Fimbriimonadales bacterium]|nr:dihydrofolate reductase family protein [Fimbriimonadales bacterium]